MGKCFERPNLSCIYANLQSFLSKKNEIEQRVKDHDFDLMLFTEVWTDERIHDSEYFNPGFQKPIVDPNFRGGACVYIRDSIEFLLIEPPSKVKESVWFLVKTNDNINRLYACVIHTHHFHHSSFSIRLLGDLKTKIFEFKNACPRESCFSV